MTDQDNPATIAASLTEAQRLELVDAWLSFGFPGEYVVMGSEPLGILADLIFGRLTPLGLAVRQILKDQSHAR